MNLIYFPERILLDSMHLMAAATLNHLGEINRTIHRGYIFSKEENDSCNSSIIRTLISAYHVSIIASTLDDTVLISF